MKRTTSILIALLLACCAWAQFGALPVVQVQRWTPLSVSGCVFWLDPSDASLLTLNGTNIVDIVDKSGTGNWGQTNASVRPFYDGTLINGLKVIRTAAPGEFIFSSTLSTVSDVFIVTRTTKHTSLGGVWGWQGHDIGIRLKSSGFWQDANNKDFAFGGSLRINGVQTNGYPTASAYLITARSATPKTSFQSGLGFYMPAYSGRYYVGLIGEVIGYSGPVSDGDRAKIESYLMTKWGISWTP